MSTAAGSAERPPALAPFHPLVAEWFLERVGEPTEVQAEAWPRITRGEHVLVTAPTGSGKTLTAFLWAIDRLLTGAWQGGRVRVLYVSPLKALNNDIRRNLLGPLAALEALFGERGEPAVPVGVATRSGDTPPRERQRMIRHPPEILITTPETLNILLTSAGGRSILGGVRCAILDEIHAVAGGKRGTHLITAVERLERLSGGLQRLALSATIRPLERIARFVGGFEMEGEGEGAVYRPRPVAVVRAARPKAYDLRVCLPEGTELPDRSVRPPGEGADGAPAPNVWESLTRAFKERIRDNRSTLLFANSRRTTEKVTRLLNDGEPAELAYSHHGSLSRELRAVVERRLKEGRLAAIVSTNSLELGIDIGALDEVVLIQTPPTVASAVQRLGRAGHAVGETSRGRLFPLFGSDLIDAAVVASCVLGAEIEEVAPVEGALDVLAQVVLSMTAAESWDLDELHAFLRCSYPYRELTRRQLDLVLEMLAGRYADSRVRELEPRVSIDRIDNTVRARRGAARLIYLSGGTIPDRGYFHLRHHETMARLGELDEEFVWERSLGDSFTLGAQSWRIRRITHNDVLVAPARRSAAMAPFWRAEERNRSFFLAEKIALFLERAEQVLAGGAPPDPASELRKLLVEEHRMEPAAAAELLDLLQRQRAETGGALPHRRHLLVEHLAGEEPGEGHRQIILHTLWGGRVNQPLAIAMAQAWKERHGVPLQIEAANDALMVALPHGAEAAELLDLVHSDDVEALLRRRLESTGFFGARFRENAGRALLLPRSDFRRRVPLWLIRQRAKKLMEAVAPYEDFPLLIETWRTCLRDELDLESLRRVLDELASGEIRVSEAHTSAPSAFSANIIWKQTNRLMYEDDVPESGASALRGDLLEELVFSSGLRPAIPAAVRERLRRKLHRTHPGYAPRSATELLDWTRERLAIPVAEWDELLAAIERDLSEAPQADPREWLEKLAAKVVRLPVGSGAEASEVVCAVEELPRVVDALGPEAAGGAAHAAAEPELLGLLGEGPPPPAALEALTRLRDGCARAPSADGQLDVGAGHQAGGEAGELGADDAAGPGAGSLESESADDPLAAFLAEWLRHYVPITRSRLAGVLGLDVGRLEAVLEELVEARTIVVDHFGEEGGAGEPEICDAENVERLLRILRAERRPTFEPLALGQLPLFLAAHQGLAARDAGLADLQRALEKLLAYPAPGGLWESDLLPARLDPYYPSWLDSLLQESDLGWVGLGAEKVGFLFAGELELLRAGTDGEGPDGPTSGGDGRTPPVERVDQTKHGAVADHGHGAGERTGDGGGDGDGAPGDTTDLLPPAAPRAPFEELARRTGLDTAELTERLWKEAWEGKIANTTFSVVRQGVLGRFHPVAVDGDRSSSAGHAGSRRSGGRRHGRRRFERWKASQPYPGEWYRLDGGAPPEPLDALDLEEINKERARLLLDRYGVVFRELLMREAPPLQWSKVFRSLRLMELSGEVLAGQFFTGIPGLQFASRAAWRRLREGLPDDLIYWVNAADPASPAGVPLEDLKGELPPRVPSSHLVFHGARLVVVSRRNGGELDIRVEPDHPCLLDYLGFLKVLLTRQFNPLKLVDLETINGEPAPGSPYAARIAEAFSAVREHRSIKLRRRY